LSHSASPQLILETLGGKDGIRVTDISMGDGWVGVGWEVTKTWHGFYMGPGVNPLAVADEKQGRAGQGHLMTGHSHGCCGQ
jgi:hypothetical protein